MSVAVVVALTIAALAVVGGDRAESSSFVPSSDEKRAEIWAVGDGADGSPESYAVAKMIARAEPDRFLYLGDVYPKGTAADFAERYEPTYGRVAAITAPTIGNHEDGQPAVRLRPVLAGDPRPHPPGLLRVPGRWMEDHEPQFARLTTHRDRHSSVGFGARSEARATAGSRSGTAPGSTPAPHIPTLAAWKAFWDALQGHARLVLNGHEHNMQRHSPTQGMVELIAGSGGNDQYPLDRSDPGLRFGNDTSPGALRLRLTPRRVRFDFVATSGRVLDTGTRRCRPNDEPALTRVDRVRTDRSGPQSGRRPTWSVNRSDKRNSPASKDPGPLRTPRKWWPTLTREM